LDDVDETGSILSLLEKGVEIPLLQGHIKASLAQIQFKSSTDELISVIEDSMQTATDENGTGVDVQKVNYAYVQLLENASEERVELSRLFDYLTYLVSEYGQFDFDQLISLYLEGLSIFDQYYGDRYEEDYEYYCQSFLCILSECENPSQMGKMLTSIIDSLRGYTNIDNRYFKSIESIVPLSSLEGLSPFDKIELLASAMEGLRAVEYSAEGLSQAQNKILEVLQKGIQDAYSEDIHNKKFDFFISYSKRNYKDIVKIKTALEDAGYSVWMDMNLKASRYYYSTQIRHAIENSDSVLFMLTDKVLERHESIFKLEFMPVYSSHKKAYPIWLENGRWDNEKIDRAHKKPEDEFKRIELKQMLTHFTQLESSRKYYEEVENIISTVLEKHQE
jgi:hypothetical protein